jgi:hypothetical protein
MVSRESRFGKKHVLVSYSYVDIKDVVRLRENLITAGEQVWWEKDILPGENSKMASRKAIENSYAVVLCLSKDSVSRPRSKLYDEALQAIAAYREYRPDSIFLIPVRLSECEVPNLEIDSNNTLRCLQYVDLFPSSQRENGLNSLLRALREAPLHPLRIGEAIVEE